MAVKVGVVGIGVHGMHHVRLLSKMDGIELAGIFDLNTETAEKVAREFGTVACSSLDELLDRVSCVSVAVPTTAHYEVVKHCFEKKRHVLVEKPIALSVEEAQSMTGDARSRGLTLAVGQIERFNPAYRSVADQTGKPVFIESHRLSVFNPRGTDVAVVLDLMIHDIDVILHMVGDSVQSVSAVGVAVVSDEVDIANARIEFDGGCVANLTASRISTRKMRKIRTFQRNAYISMDFLTGESEVFLLNQDGKPLAQPGAVPQLMEGISYRKYPSDGLNALEMELADFIRAAETGSHPRVTGEEGTAALSVASRVMESMETSMRRMR